MIKKGSRLIVKTAHRSNYPDPIKFKQGDTVQVGREDDRYSGWVWTTTGDGNSGWAPRQRLAIDGDRAVTLADYEATELNTVMGQELTILTSLNGWYWVQTRLGKTGWIPAETVERWESQCIQILTLQAGL